MGFIGSMTEYFFPGFISSSSYLDIIEKKDNRSRVYDSYFILSNREDPIAINTALTDIKSDDDYLWLNASLYLGRVRRIEAIPYLIKALRHTAWRSVDERVEMLNDLTGMRFTNNFTQWKAWWIQEDPEFEINWDSSLGHNPKIENDIEPVN
mgnify:CR=1 FL=1